PVAARGGAVAGDLPSSDHTIEILAHGVTEFLAAADGEIVEVVPPDAVLRNVGIALVPVEAQTVLDVVGHGSGQEDFGLVILIGSETASLRCHVTCRRGIAHEIEDLKSQAAAETPL